MIIKPAKPGDIPALQAVVEQTGMFPGEMLPDMMSDGLAGKEDAGFWLTCEVGGEAIGFCYAVPEQLAEGTWNMLALAVHPARQGLGYGRAMVGHLERLLREKGHRILIVDTSGKDAFAPTRAFYRKSGYSEEARIHDFWADGDDKVVFWKRLSQP